MAALLFLLTVTTLPNQTPPSGSVAFSLKNETNIGIVVQVISTFNGKLLRDRPYLLSPGESTPQIVMPGKKTVSIGDAKNPAKPKLQLGIPTSKDEAVFAIIGTDTPLRLESRKAGK